MASSNSQINYIDPSLSPKIRLVFLYYISGYVKPTQLLYTSYTPLKIRFDLIIYFMYEIHEFVFQLTWLVKIGVKWKPNMFFCPAYYYHDLLLDTIGIENFNHS